MHHADSDRTLHLRNERSVIVLTRDFSYRKGPNPEFPRSVLHVKYGDYPLFVDAMMKRPETYNNELDVCRRQEKAGKAFVIRPSSPIVISRYEKDPEKLNKIYEMGIHDCENSLNNLNKFLN